MRFLVFVDQGEMLPRWYGVAWQDLIRQGCWAAPVPINCIIAVGRTVWWGFKAPSTLVRYHVLQQKIKALRLRNSMLTADLWDTHNLLCNLRTWLEQGSLSSTDYLYGELVKKICDIEESS